jgi:hypothetical protein
MKALSAILAAAALAAVPAAAPAQPVESELMEYDITWVGVSVGTMSVRSETGADGAVFRAIRIWNRPWIALVYPVDNTVECRIEATPEGPRHTVTKKVGEKNFKQDDTLLLWPEAGRTVWSNALQGTVQEFQVPRGARDYVSFFFDLRAAAGGDGRWAARGDYQLVMDGAVHRLNIESGEPETVRTPHGRLEAIPVKAISKSTVLFSRNKPRAVWVATRRPVVLLADVDTRFGTVRASLVKWESNGQAVPLAAH